MHSHKIESQKHSMKKAVVIGSGFAGIAAASVLAKQGVSVTVLEKNDSLGGRARQYSADGFVFDMGPSWYWMPEVFESYFRLFGRNVADYYDLRQLDPSYQIYFGKDDLLQIPAQPEALDAVFEKIEPGSSAKLRQFLDEAAFKYNVGMERLVYNPGQSLTEFLDRDFLKGVLKLHVFQSLHAYVRKYFRDTRLIRLMEFPVLFLGGMPKNTPALYSLMNYAALSLGTWYPMGGMYKIIEGMVSLAESLGVKFVPGAEVSEIEVRNSQAVGVRAADTRYPADCVIAGADYHHVEQKLLRPEHRMYSENYWQKRVLAPSSLIFYLGIDKKLDHLQHHNLFFDEDLDAHAQEIYETKRWPEKPLFYVCAPSKTDDSVAPQGCENLFVLIPLAPDLKDTDVLRQRYFDIVMSRLEKLTGQAVRNHIVYQRSYCVQDFKNDYHAFKGNAYGLANTLRQTANLKPSLVSKKVHNLYFAGQLTVPGPGVPPSLISGQVAANEALKRLNQI